jgi:hypothetical protein
MKKIYMIPTTLVVKIETVQMIAESVVGVGRAYQSGDAVLSRESSGWDDDE